MIKITVDFGGLAGLAEPVMMDNLHRALRLAAIRGAEACQLYWLSMAQGAGVRASGDYLAGLRGSASVQLIKSGVNGTQVDVEVHVVARAAHSRYVEEGHSAFHLPSVMSWTSASVKKTREGKLYVVVPFRHRMYLSPGEADAQGFTPASRRQMMPSEVYQEAQELAFTVKQNAGRQFNSKGDFVAADRYERGYRDVGGTFQQTETDPSKSRLIRTSTPQINLAAPGQSHAGATFEEHRGARIVGYYSHGEKKGQPMVNPAWGGSKFSGMIRSGAPGHSQYLTFRVITPTSPGWHIPAQAGHYLGAKTASAAPSLFEPILRASLGGFVDVGVR